MMKSFYAYKVRNLILKETDHNKSFEELIGFLDTYENYRKERGDIIEKYLPYDDDFSGELPEQLKQQKEQEEYELDNYYYKELGNRVIDAKHNIYRYQITGLILHKIKFNIDYFEGKITELDLFLDDAIILYWAYYDILDHEEWFQAMKEYDDYIESYSYCYDNDDYYYDDY